MTRWHVNDIRASKMRELGWEGPSIDQILILDRPPSEAVKCEGRNCVVARLSYEGRSAELTDDHLRDAHLIAAAPELYEALALLTDVARIRAGNVDKVFAEPLAKAEAALSRARGEAS